MCLCDKHFHGRFSGALRLPSTTNISPLFPTFIGFEITSGSPAITELLGTAIISTGKCAMQMSVMLETSIVGIVSKETGTASVGN